MTNGVSPPGSLNVLMGFYFYPRGGSAYVARYLCGELLKRDLSVRLLTGSLGPAGSLTCAGSFFAGVPDLIPVDYTAALRAFERGEDPLMAEVPLHGSYEDRPDVPDRVLAALSSEGLALQEDFWARQFSANGTERADVIHLHHLTPQLAPALMTGRPVITHLHGTELKFLMECARRRSQPDGNWQYAATWLDRMRGLAPRIARVVTVSEGDAELAQEVLGLSAADVQVIPNGVDTTEFSAVAVTGAHRDLLWHKWLVRNPQGWDESGVIGSVRYSDETVRQLLSSSGDRLVVLCVSRFLYFKRVDWLIESFSRIRDRIPPTTLVIWGGFPGEWEGEHPVATVRRLSLEDDVVFTGFRGHDDLVLAFNMADLAVNTTAHEPFGQVLVEAMASGTPVVAADAGGPATFVPVSEPDAGGWLFEPHARESLDAVLIEALSSRAELRRRGENARRHVSENYAWSRFAGQLEELYGELAG